MVNFPPTAQPHVIFQCLAIDGLNRGFFPQDLDKPVVLVVFFVGARTFIRRFENGSPAYGAIISDQAKRYIQERPFLIDNGPQRSKAQLEFLVCFDLAFLRLAVGTQHLKAELPRPTGAAEELADHAMVLILTLGFGGITSLSPEAAHQHLEPPAKGAEKAGRNKAPALAIGIAGPNIGQRPEMPNFRVCRGRFPPVSLLASRYDAQPPAIKTICNAAKTT